MKRLLAIAMILCLLCPVSVQAELDLELDPVEQELQMGYERLEPGEEVAPAKKGKSWLYLVLGIGLVGAAAGGGGGGGGGSSSTDGSMTVTW